MGFFIRFLAITALVSSTVVGQSAGPSPTASVGCEPHGDHWYACPLKPVRPCHLVYVFGLANICSLGTVMARHPLLYHLLHPLLVNPLQPQPLQPHQRRLVPLSLSAASPMAITGTAMDRLRHLVLQLQAPLRRLRTKTTLPGPKEFKFFYLPDYHLLPLA